MKNLLGPVVLLILIAAVTIVLATQDKEHGGRPITATLTGAAEVPGPGDEDGTGSFKLTLNPGQNQICYELSVSKIATPTMAHIHIGKATEAGAVLVTLKTPENEPVKECKEMDRDQLKQILQTPSNYYVNVHNSDFPDGAIRGQLSK